ncbi:S-adenosyl-L-methionine-dependent methyltransferase [Exidia glandulosa HHB12029]|uniref:S-adenosyl-L-methionine-dependent methyltransferase n=1 Tax=Exidia glandulosa HHB12029 TaxID=1314781 RepID=A0A165Q6S7_EXIGL|nr:S-adenosyl-L-methionine-dependent methyltransferase [Exidia glandulosa HHB12029]
MATFAKATYNATSYAAYRPTYPRQIYDRVLAFHRAGPKPQWRKHLDIGCGTGQVTTEPVLLGAFAQTVGADPSPQMVAQAQKLAKELPDGSKIPKYIAAKAEQLDVLRDESVDLVTVGQAAHWFDYTRVWGELARVMAPGGSFAFWGYSEFRFTKYPSLTPMITHYSQGGSFSPQAKPLGAAARPPPPPDQDEDSVSAFWQQPGRWLVETHLQHVPQPPHPPFTDVQQVFFTGPHFPQYTAQGREVQPVILTKVLDWPGVEAYLRTWSSLHTYQEVRPYDKAKIGVQDGKGSPDGDVVQRLLWRLRNRIVKETGSSNVEEEVQLEWPLVLIMGRKEGAAD